MSDVLTEICEVKRVHVDACQQEIPLGEMEQRARAAAPTRGFVTALRRAVDSGTYGLIAELKKASPSKGLIRADFDPASLAQAYAEGGATCLSVLTDTPYFQGEDSYLAEARNAVDLPVLRKDFMIDPYQIIEARAIGADCILLIMAALSDGQAYELEACAVEQGLDVLIEVHDHDELDRALNLDSPLIGVNNRNLKDLSVDIARSEEMLMHFPANRLAVSESGLYSPDDLARMAAAGANCFLVGESLMREDDVEAATRALLAAA
jgi:indole-3-glycerol phosphate synthase